MKRLAIALALWGGFGLAVAMAQMPPPPTPTPTSPTPPPTQVPLDGGIILLAAAGAAYGAKKMYVRKKTTHV